MKRFLWIASAARHLHRYGLSWPSAWRYSRWMHQDYGHLYTPNEAFEMEVSRWEEAAE